MALFENPLGSTTSFYNLCTCVQGHGNPCNVILGVVPPTVEEYLYSANHNLLIPLSIDDGEDGNFSVEDYGNARLYCQINFDCSKSIDIDNIHFVFIK